MNNSSRPQLGQNREKRNDMLSTNNSHKAALRDIQAIKSEAPLNLKSSNFNEKPYSQRDENVPTPIRCASPVDISRQLKERERSVPGSYK